MSPKRARPRTYRQHLVLEIEYGVGVQDTDFGHWEGGVEVPPHMDELHFDIFEEQAFDAHDERTPTGKTQIQLRG